VKSLLTSLTCSAEDNESLKPFDPVSKRTIWPVTGNAKSHARMDSSLASRSATWFQFITKGPELKTGCDW
jgi:hypothetical protein